MKKTTPILISLAVLLFTNPVSLLAATDQELQKEYEQARKIALKDPKVRAAYDRAEETLNDRVVSIDPTLKPYVEKRRAGSQVRQEKVQPAKHAVVSKKQPEPTGTTHTVARGETLSTIALHYKVSVSSLKTLNGITDEKKLQVGQVLKIPSGGTTKKHAEENNETWWDRLKKTL